MNIESLIGSPLQVLAFGFMFGLVAGVCVAAQALMAGDDEDVG